MRLICFGDSNTYGYDPRSFLGGRYPTENRWTDLLAGMTGRDVLNLGLNGREIPASPESLTELPRQDDLLIVMLGSNDLLCHPRFTAGNVAARMEGFLQSLPSCRILLTAPPPMALGTWVAEERLIRESTALAEEYETLARRLGIGFADAGQWGVELTFDGVHFSPAGHQAFAKGLRELLVRGFNI